MSAGNPVKDSLEISFTDDAAKKRRRDWLLLVAVSFAIAALLRLVRIDYREFFGNEFLTLNLLGGGGPEIFLGRALEGAASIYHVFLKAWVNGRCSRTRRSPITIAYLISDRGKKLCDFLIAEHLCMDVAVTQIGQEKPMVSVTNKRNCGSVLVFALLGLIALLAIGVVVISRASRDAQVTSVEQAPVDSNQPEDAMTTATVVTSTTMENTSDSTTTAAEAVPAEVNFPPPPPPVNTPDTRNLPPEG